MKRHEPRDGALMPVIRSREEMSSHQSHRVAETARCVLLKRGEMGQTRFPVKSERVYMPWHATQ